MNSYDRIFGSGPKCALFSTALFVLGYFIEDTVGLPQIFTNEIVSFSLFVVFSLAGSALVVWSLYSLPPKERGRRLVISGAFKYFRHPLYAAFLLCFSLGFSFLLNNWIYLVWSLVLFPIWSINVKSEEKLMRNAFGEEYKDYCEKTGRFLPKW